MWHNLLITLCNSLCNDSALCQGYIAIRNWYKKLAKFNKCNNGSVSCRRVKNDRLNTLFATRAV